MVEKSLQQGNPTLDKMSARLHLAGAGELGPILKGLGGTITLTLGPDEDLVYVRIHSDVGSFNNLLSGTFTSLDGGRREWSTDIVYGTDTAFGLTGGRAARNYLEWQIRKLEVPNVVSEPDDLDTPLDRAFFDSTRSYSLEVVTALNDGEFEGPVGAAFRDSTKELYVLAESGHIKVVNRAGIATRASNISLPSSPFRVPVDIEYLGSDRFAILNAGDTDYPPSIVLFHIREDEEELLDDFKTYLLSDVLETGGSVRGLCYDPWREKFYVGTESTATGEGGLYEVDLTRDNTDGAITADLLFDWADVIVSTDGVGAGALLGGLYYSRGLAAGAANDSIFGLFHAPAGGGPADQRVIVQFDIQSGAPISEFFYNMEGDFRGAVWSEYNEDLFFFATTPGINFWRYSHTGYTDTQTFSRSFYVKDVPYAGGLYLHNQEAQLGEAIVHINKDDPNRFARDATFGINVLPVFNDEFFTQHEYRGNRFAQTLRNWGGAATVEFWVEGVKVISEIDIADLDGYYWPTPDYGLHNVFVRLRADTGSPYAVDIPGYIRFRQFDCP
ncbi:MAG: hypothetical protein JSW58_08385 [Candidatus Latescibacterota bacterium]|nr:MAG: hypothetical protein JSW58_08385 [Candidatus Latescibacterota bacterium]